ncbi:glycosyltransferase family 4 protein [Psychrobacter sp. M13]|uniref:glycosyltransferase family 4 protein n=1 Tax=Psychrobacter sp. M13 TaxID=3067275 RepID=UPI00273BF90D|nr:glycosyltransferase family 4 protein [Psychrobacter sp. M13]WLP94719.1 glycosyltransferase family 4 protein [Psychrobacter sp. M13]
MKILMVLFYGLNKGAGVERVGSMIANGLLDAGHEVILASIGPCDTPFFPLNKDIKIIPLSDSEHANWNRIPNIVYETNIIYKIRKLLKTQSIDIVMAVDIKCIPYTLPATLGLTVKHIGWEHFNFDPNQAMSASSLFRHLAARYCDSVVVLTQRDKEYWLKHTRHQSQISAIANPCPFPVQEYIKENKKIVLAVGRLDRDKGFDLLLKAWLHIVTVMPEWRLKIVGEGEQRAELTQFIRANQITESVELVGATDDVSHYYKQAEIFCLPSRIEGFGMVLTEALAFGLPIVSFDCGPGPAEVLKDTGSILVPKNDISQLALALIHLMKDDEQRVRIGLKGKEKVEIYQPDTIIEEWLSLLKNLE